ncbi:coA-transferase III family protein [Mycolicibacterium hassiacum DSM 44199]|uniref:CoA-transferase III family protein n=1 Tax=Mycolicibacterium hassiacum (strain DSM 44199 / CIP 105218 / JCM 12690 / 3849) TaxID=1122247 RepID=K5BKK8_MYCHD|nr:CoA transferase [Mycolicibacterium hassiacum]EKF25039.1 coA-transferase III family protein [Mycolicibacterium hassiacum DSM 44199]MDA4087947.1 formyl-CoA transferase [Mycolicibacterium hassiacum DSM 44199]VCT93237.1 Cinnamoyl-CoA:phenyllactate CoA-transferase [Mycolicibacterium hassiacum DSM 44199]
MTGPFEGVRVVEVASWTFVPGAGAIMADLGADVIKVEPPDGDPQRALRNALNIDDSGPNPFLHVPNRGKRSITLNLATPAGLETLRRLTRNADVFLTNYLPKVRAKLGIDVDDLRADNPRLVYVRGSGWGNTGPMADTGGFDSAAAWSAAGVQHKLTEPGADAPVPQPAAFFDLQGSSAIAGAVAMALFRRERTGEGGVVDVSLLGIGMWTMGPDLAAAAAGAGELPRIDRRDAPNPIVNLYRTADDRWLNLVCLQADRFWGELCGLIGRPELADDDRFRDSAARYLNRAECIAELDKTFATRTLAEWQEILAEFSGVWSVAATFEEVCANPQVHANGYLPTVVGNDGRQFRLVAPPYQFDGVPAAPAGPAPELGQHTEEVLLEAGLDWDEISALRDSGALG